MLYLDLAMMWSSSAHLFCEIIFASILKILLLTHKKYSSLILIVVYIWVLPRDKLSVTGKLNFSTPFVCRWGSQLPECLKSHCGSKDFILVKVSFLRSIHKFNVIKGSQVIHDWHLHTHSHMQYINSVFMALHAINSTAIKFWHNTVFQKASTS